MRRCREPVPRLNGRSLRSRLSRLILVAAAACLLHNENSSRPNWFRVTASDEAPAGDKLRQLTPGTLLSDQLAGGDAHIYTINLNRGQFLRVNFEKYDLNLSVTLDGPDGRQYLELGRRHYGLVPLAFIAETNGAHRLVLRSREAGREGRSYRLKVEDARDARPQDKRNVMASAAFASAENLRAEWKSDALREAIRLYGAALPAWETARHADEAFEAYLSIGDVHFALSEYRLALTYYGKALAASRGSGDREAEIEALSQIGYAHIYLGENQPALDYLSTAHERIRRLWPSGGTTEYQRREAQALNNMGEVFYSRTDLKKSVEYFERARSLWTAVGDRRGQALAHLNLGYSLTDLGDLTHAFEHYGEALALWETVDDRRGEALARTALGGVQSFFGDKQLALGAHNHALRFFRAMGNRQGEAAAINGIAQAYEDLGEKQTALDHYQRALELYEEIGNRDFAALTMYYVGRVSLSMGDNSAALDFYQRSLALSRAVGDLQIEAHSLRGLGMVYDATGDKARGLSHYRAGLALYQQIGDRRGQARTLNNIGYVYYRQSDAQKALDAYRQALSLARAVYDRREEVSTLYNIARAERDLGSFDEAVAHIEAALNLVESLRVKVVSQELRSSYFASVQELYETYIDLLMRPHGSRPAGGSATSALEASEQSRARSLLEILTEEKVTVRHGVPEALLAQERALQQLLDARAEYRMKLLNGKHTDEQAGEAAREIRELTSRYQDVQAQIREHAPSYAILTQPALARVGEIQAALGDDTLLLEYALGEERSYLWAVSADGVEGYELPSRVIVDEAARKVYNLLTARQESGEESYAQKRVAEADAQYWEQAGVLSWMLLGPVASRLGTKRLLIVGDGALHQIPFEALPVPTPPGQAPSAAQDRPADAVPLILRHEIVSLPSASVLVALRRAKATRGGEQKIIALLADPVFDKDDPRVRAANPEEVSVAAIEPPHANAEGQRALRNFSERNGTDGIPRLPSTRREAEAIMSFLPEEKGIVATGFDASRRTLSQTDLSKFRIVHFATHGILDSEHPEFSGIILSLVDQQGTPQNGFLRLHDIYNLELDADLVVLSACRSGLGKNVRGEGIIGLTRGFMYAGSQSVVASLWRVEDEATAELMKYFYGAMLKDRLAPAAALRAAKEAMWGQERWRAPYFWAAFVLQGEYRNPIFEEGWFSGKASGVMLIAGALAAVVLSYCLVKRRRKRLGIGVLAAPPKTRTPRLR